MHVFSLSYVTLSSCMSNGTNRVKSFVCKGILNCIRIIKYFSSLFSQNSASELKMVTSTGLFQENF